ncbi:Solute carrier 49 member 4, partial [Halocaridina rubra]
MCAQRKEIYGDGEGAVSTAKEYQTKSFESHIAYRRRFWVLGIFSVLVWFQCLMWNTWGPISESMEVAFDGWGSETVAAMANWGTFTFILFLFPLIWLVDNKGLRVGVLTISGFVCLATAVRIIPLLLGSSDKAFTA